MDTLVLKKLLDYDFFKEQKTNLKSSLFQGNYKNLYRCISDAHDKFSSNLSTTDLYACWLQANPVATQSEQHDVRQQIDSIDRASELGDGVAQHYVKELWKRDIGTKIANLGIEIAHQQSPDAFDKLKSLIDSTKDGMMPTEFGEPTTKNIEKLLFKTSNENRWKFNISTLSRSVYGIGPGEFMGVMALPETGKSAFAISLCCGPGGFAEQGARVIYLGNEEETERTMLRSIQAYAGMTREEIAKNPSEAVGRFSTIENNITMQDVQEWDLAKIEAYIEHEGCDILILDQGDKCQISGSFNSSHERLRGLFQSLRELAKRQQVGLITVSQASAEARGKVRLSGFDMEGSKIGKMAELDLCIGIGKHEQGDVDDSEPDNTRYLTVSKNKLSGWHGTIICSLEGDTSRYVE
jgi:replicative DNA helicase